MARIRSIHPGFFTDEHLVTTSAFARLLFLGILTEADDNGVFEWKPLTLKMRLFPADAVDIPTLLAELVGVDAVTRVEVDGRECGAVRNFCKFQRPKKPNIKLVIPLKFRTYVGLKPCGTELNGHDDDVVLHGFPTASPPGGKSLRRWRGGEEGMVEESGRPASEEEERD